jgi:hypothetical protein
MALQNFVPGKGSREPEEPPIRRNRRPAHAPTFATSHDEPEPNMVTDEEVGRGCTDGPVQQLRPPPLEKDPLAPHSRPHEWPPTSP